MINYAMSMAHGKVGTVAKCLIVLGLVAACADTGGGFHNAGS